MSVSVVVPTQYRRPTLFRAVQSVLVFPCVERIVVVANGPRSDQEVNLPSDDRVMVVATPRAGAGWARNLGVQHSASEFVAFLDDDDELLPDWWALVEQASSHELDVVTGCMELRGPRGSAIAPRHVTPGDMGPLVQHRDGLFFAGAFLVRRSVLQTVGGYDVELAFSENFELSMRLASVVPAERWATVSAPVVAVHRDPDDRSSDELARARSIERMLSVHADVFARVPDTHQAYLVQAATMWARQWRYVRSYRAIAEAVKVAPRRVRPWLRTVVLPIMPLWRVLSRWRVPLRGTRCRPRDDSVPSSTASSGMSGVDHERDESDPPYRGLQRRGRPTQLMPEEAGLQPVAGITVVIPALNAEATLAGQLAALARQADAPPFAVIVVDNGSEDGTANVAWSFADRLNLTVVHEMRRGVNWARNAGVGAACDGVVLLCDADDEVAENWVRSLAGAVADECFVGGRLVYSTLNTSTTMQRWRVLDGIAGEPGPLDVPGGNCGFGRTMWLRVGGFDTTLSGAGDETEFFARASTLGYRPRHVRDAEVHVRLRSHAASMLKNMYRRGVSQATTRSRRPQPPHFQPLAFRGVARSWLYYVARLFASPFRGDVVGTLGDLSRMSGMLVGLTTVNLSLGVRRAAEGLQRSKTKGGRRLPN